MSTPRTPARRGFTLIELLVGITVSSVVLLAVAATIIAVNDIFQKNTVSKTAVEGSRVGMDYLNRTLRYAGYGLDPAIAFDFGTDGLPEDRKDNYTEEVEDWGSFVTDDLAFRYRDPMYLRRGQLDGTGAPPFQLTLEPAANFGQPLRQGQAVLVACPGGQDYFLGRLAADVTADGTTASLETALAAGIPGDVPKGCMTDSTRMPFVMLVQEKRLRVEAHGGRPYLVVKHGWAEDADFDPIAADVESFQVSYQMNRPPANSACCAGQAAPDGAVGSGMAWVLGDEDAVMLPKYDADVPPPTYSTPYDDALRYNMNTANIRSVGVGLTVRSVRPMPSGKKNQARRLFNADPVNGEDTFFRTTVETSVRIPNMTSRAFFIPELRAAGVAGDLKNVWGG
ncbi:PilW family protein [Corallococcus macrosporus]|uniref:Prepilin cleavage protein n=1 Tax=Corallococcus macrosporus DSM 14697 TaxID=1189310 RepID=A0A250JPI9_9BACT|nr:prepilin-type N-terminal cleavage/methylation domain-containing protein [Corallococcus macrosporus]ATB45775.1 prepilin cleavage protein [Corallococcus macrosporus DSM 14697]